MPCIYTVYTNLPHDTTGVLRVGARTMVHTACTQANSVIARVRNSELDPVVPPRPELVPGSGLATLTLDMGWIGPDERATVFAAAEVDRRSAATIITATSVEACKAAVKIVGRDATGTDTDVAVEALYTSSFVFDHCYVRDFFTRINRLSFVTVRRTHHQFTVLLGLNGELVFPLYETSDQGTNVVPVYTQTYLYTCDAEININTIRITVECPFRTPVLGYSLSELVSYALYQPHVFPVLPPVAGLPTQWRWNDMRRAVPNIYPIGFPRKIHGNRIMVPLPLEMYDPTSPHQMLFPPSGPLQCVFQCVHPDYPYPGMITNKCWNAGTFPLLPAACKQPFAPIPAPALPVIKCAAGTFAQLGMPLDAAVARAVSREQLPLSALAKLAETCLQSCYDQCVEDIRADLSAARFRPERHWRVMEEAYACTLFVIDALTGEYVLPRSAFVYVYSATEPRTQVVLLQTAPYEYNVRLASGDSAPPTLRRVQGTVTVATDGTVQAVQADAMVIEPPPHVCPAEQYVDAFGRVRAIRCVSSGVLVRNICRDTYAHVRVIAMSEPWQSTPRVDPSVAMLLNRTPRWLAKYGAFGAYIDAENNRTSLQVHTSCRRLPVENKPREKYERARVPIPYVIFTESGIEARNIKV